MSTNKPRITVTLEPRTYELLKSISDSGGQSMSSFVGELLQQNSPVLEKMAIAFQKIKASSDARKAQMAEAFDQIQNDLEPLLQSAIGQFDMFLGAVTDAATGPASPPTRGPTRGDTGGGGAGDLERASGSAVRAKAPATKRSAPLTNRGVTTTVKTRKTPAKSKR